MSPTNFDEEAGFVFSFSSPFKYKFWTSNNNISLNYSSVKDTRIIKSKATVFMYIHANQQFIINDLMHHVKHSKIRFSLSYFSLYELKLLHTIYLRIHSCRKNEHCGF